LARSGSTGRTLKAAEMEKVGHDAIYHRIMHYGLDRFEALSNNDKHELIRQFAADIIEERERETCAKRRNG